MRGYLRIFEDIYQTNIGKNQVRQKMNSHFEKNEKWTNESEIDVIMVRKLNYMENDAELDGQWSNLMDKDAF